MSEETPAGYAVPRALASRAVEAAVFAAVALLGQYQLLASDIRELKQSQFQCDAAVGKLRKEIRAHRHQSGEEEALKKEQFVHEHEDGQQP